MKNRTNTVSANMVVNWTLDKNGSLTISGSGRMPDYACGKNPVSPWDNKKEMITGIIIKEGITEIGINAFRDCTNLKKVSLPDSIRRVHAYAFRNCTSLEEIASSRSEWKYIYDNKTTAEADTIIFGVEAFLNVPWAVHKWDNFYIHDNTLYVCFSGGDRLVIPDGVHLLRRFSFSHIETAGIVLPDSLEIIENFAFSNAVVRGKIRLPDEISDIGGWALADCKFYSISFPAGWKPQKIFWSRTTVKMTCRQRFPEFINKYSVALEKIKGTGKFFRMKIRENKPVIHRNGQITAIRDDDFIDVGAGILRRIQRGRVLICVTYEDNRIVSVKSFALDEYYKLPNEYLMYPMITDEGGIEIWSDSFTYQEPDDIRYAFSDQNGKALAQAGKLRFRHPDTHEEWFWCNDRGDFGGPLELELLKLWLETHPEITVDSMDDNLEKSRYRWFVNV